MAEASAAVTLVEIKRSSCSGVVGISSSDSCLRRLNEDAGVEEDVATVVGALLNRYSKGKGGYYGYSYG